MDFYIHQQRPNCNLAVGLYQPPSPYTAYAIGIAPNSRRWLGFILEFSLANLPPVTNRGMKMLS
jgi:hypothetical protein